MRDGVTPAAGERVKVPVHRERQRVGRYELLFELARGGMGSVWVGRLGGAHGFGRFVAIKALRKTGDDGEAHAQFLEEAKVTARIHHPCVVSTLELFEHAGEPYIVMDLVEGVALSRLLDRLDAAGETMPPELAAWVVMQVASGLHVAHELRDRSGVSLDLVHRDVSPQNVLLSFEGRAYVADFGIAKFRRASVATESGVIKGKFAYMSPEQARAQPLDRRSDIFSLGIVLYEAMTGKRLYPAEQAADALIKIVSEPPPDPRRVVPGIPAELAAIALRCLQKRPEERYQTAEELRDALRSALQAVGAPVDEHRLATLLARRFHEDATSLRERLAAVDGDEGRGADLGATLPVTDDAATERSSKPPVSVAPASGARPITLEGNGASRSRAPLVAAIAVVIAACVVVAFVAYRAWARPAVPIASNTSATSSVSPDTASSAPEATSAPLASASADAPRVALEAPPPGRSTARPVGPIRASSPAPRTTGGAGASAARPPPAPTSSSSKGVPFKDL